MSSISRVRRGLWRASSVLGDIDAASRSIETGSPMPYAKRLGRKRAYRSGGSAMRKFLRWAGLS